MSWIKELRKALKTGTFSEAAKADAADWTTCAVGEAHKRAPKIVVGIDESEDAMDRVLVNLGRQFDIAVNGDHVKDAARIYARIQKRTTELALGL